ncbi:MAG: nitroreductase family protein [Desulfopila sp.]
MSFITIDPVTCNHDGLCVQSCPVTILRKDEGGLPFMLEEDSETCILCGHCVAVCPTGAFSHSRLALREFLPVPKNKADADALEALLLSRRSVRMFKKQPVPRQQLERLLEIGRRAPTASNSQNLSWNIITDPDRLAKIEQLAAAWLASDPERSHYAQAAASGRDVVLRGGTALVVPSCPDDYGWTDTDCAIALSYMELLAASLGLGACWGGLVTRAGREVVELRAVLGIPDGQTIGGALILGVPRQRHFRIPPRNRARVNWL